MVEAIESEFVPLAVYNNRPGADAALLERYHEAAWNNPVVRFFAPDGHELVERKDRVWEADAVARRMVAALEAARRPVPAYLRLALEELDPAPLQRAVFGMHCFWQGEAALGGLAGVRQTRPAFLDGHEVVEVRFDPRTLPFRELVARARERDCARLIFATDRAQADTARELMGDAVRLRDERPRDAGPGDRLYHLAHSPLRFLPLTPLQAQRVNSALQAEGDPRELLSPRQRVLAMRIEARLASAPRALDGLARPETLDGLDLYGTALEKRLAER